MKQLAFICACTAFFAIAVLGCRRTRVVHHRERPRPVVRERVYVEAHVCTYACENHYWDGHRLVEIPGHHHGPSCGHYWNDAHWVVRVVDPGYRVDRRRRPAPPVHVEQPHGGSRQAVKVKHVHGPTCGHVYNGRSGRWIKVKAQGHRHGPGCGHVHINGRWTIRH